MLVVSEVNCELVLRRQQRKTAESVMNGVVLLYHEEDGRRFSGVVCRLDKMAISQTCYNENKTVG